MTGWIGVDLDGTLAHYDGWDGPYTIGAPIPAMVERVKRWLADGYEVRIVTARVSGSELIERERVKSIIREWSERFIGKELPVTCSKDYAMIELWDDRCVQVIANTGEPVGQSTRGLS